MRHAIGNCVHDRRAIVVSESISLKTSYISCSILHVDLFHRHRCRSLPSHTPRVKCNPPQFPPQLFVTSKSSHILQSWSTLSASSTSVSHSIVTYGISLLTTQTIDRWRHALCWRAWFWHLERRSCITLLSLCYFRRDVVMNAHQ